MGPLRHTLQILLLSHIAGFALCQPELLKNADFEEPFVDQENWWCNDCVLDRSTDSNTGQYSGRVTARAAKYASVTQFVILKPNTKYYFSANIKLLNQVSGFQNHQVDLQLAITYDDSPIQEYIFFGRLPHIETAHGWQLMGGDLILGNREISQVRIYFPIPEAGVDFLIDTASFTEIVPNPNWLVEANARIEQMRRTDIKFNVSIGSSYNPSDIRLAVNLRRHAVPFGSAIAANRISDTIDEVNQRYQQFFYDNFEYAVIENALKWKQMEKVQGEINFDTPKRAIDALERNDIPVRGHCVYWEVDKNVPDWLFDMSSEELRSQITRRAEYVVNAFKGRLVHWDVNNEDLHGDFFKRSTGDTNIINTMFNEVHQHDVNASLFLNDFNIVNTGTHTTAFLNQANRVKASGAPVNGIGVQSHLNGFDADILQKRLDVVAKAGLPIWITELDYPNVDENIKADTYESALRLYYSHPDVEGIMLWGFWDGRHWKPDAALVEGEDFVINEAGRRWQQLVKNEWNTSATLQPSSASEILDLRGFQGLYTVDVMHQGNTVFTKYFDILNKATSHEVYINIV